MDATMFQLRSFVHQRLYTAAEEILGEVEKTITLALYEAEVSRSKEEVESLRHQLDLLRKKPAEEPSLTCSTVEHGGERDAPGPSTPEETNFNLSTEVPGPSQTCTDVENNNWTYCLGETDFKMSEIKEEQDSQTQEIICPSPEIVKSEQDQPETHASYEMQPVSSAQSEDDDGDEELKESKGEQTEMMQQKGKILQGQSGSVDKKPYDKCSAKHEKGRSFCHLCGKGFQYIGSLMKHIKTHENKIDCTVCGMTHQSTEELITHLKGRHNKTYFCDVCGKTFANNRCLRLHERIHTGVREFMCQECDKTFYRREHLIVHVRTHSGEKPYHCDICGKAFSQSQNLTIHKRSHSGERPYHCGLCGKLFNTSSHLKTHMRYHSGEKPYPCDICGKSFRQSGQMTRHRTTHTGERPYACHVCGMRYRFAPNLKVHLQTHEKPAAE
ncbi:hypothetical protein D5F01_LYC18546 [Larimichthys crocea]|uniref:C2H2-type domain-containing protein n=1 Tax=Larimichthys crocea TaxID=215358 RepID=A0A6G0HVD0_LARCR|nr:hypothetical protein D5F01_LYC18546 [Larimichthys crocea]